MKQSANGPQFVTVDDLVLVHHQPLLHGKSGHQAHSEQLVVAQRTPQRLAIQREDAPAWDQSPGRPFEGAKPIAQDLFQDLHVDRPQNL